jgi:hypothetical protein
MKLELLWREFCMKIKCQLMVIGMSASLVAAEPLLLLSSQLDQLSNVATEMSAQDIVDKFNAWKASQPFWGQRPGIMDLQGKIIEPAESYDEMEGRLYRDISWEGLAKKIGITQSYKDESQLKQAVINRLKSAGAQGENFSILSEEKINNIIQEKLERLVKDLINTLTANYITVVGNGFIQSADVSKESEILMCYEKILATCEQAIQPQFYDDFIFFLEKRKLAGQWYKKVHSTWCEVIREAVIQPYTDLVRTLIKNIVALYKGNISQVISTMQQLQKSKIQNKDPLKLYQKRSYGYIFCGLDDINLQKILQDMQRSH